MANSTKTRSKSEDFPLWQRKDGRWCRKIRGRIYYFGYDKEAALDEWLRVKDYRLNGLEPPPKDAPDALTMKALVNKYLAAKQSDIDAGVYARRTFQAVVASCDRILKHFGKNRLVSDIRQEDFAAYRASFVQRHCGMNTISTEITRCRALFNFAYETELIDAPLRYGPQFKIGKKAAQRHNGRVASKMFEADEIKQMIDAAGVQLKAMILLGINCGFGNTDCAELPKSAVDLKGGWIEFPRPKTGVDRKAALWPETVKALRAATSRRSESKNQEDNGLVFLTTYGNPWVRMRTTASGKDACQDSITIMFRELLKGLEKQQKGRAFYSLRRTYRTIADATQDWPAVNLTMGHTDPTIGGVYRQRIADERLRAVADHVHAWLFGKGGAE